MKISKAKLREIVDQEIQDILKEAGGGGGPGWGPGPQFPTPDLTPRGPHPHAGMTGEQIRAAKRAQVIQRVVDNPHPLSDAGRRARPATTQARPTTARPTGGGRWQRGFGRPGVPVVRGGWGGRLATGLGRGGKLLLNPYLAAAGVGYAGGGWVDKNLYGGALYPGQTDPDAPPNPQAFLEPFIPSDLPDDYQTTLYRMEGGQADDPDYHMSGETGWLPGSALSHERREAAYTYDPATGDRIRVRDLPRDLLDQYNTANRTGDWSDTPWADVYGREPDPWEGDFDVQTRPLGGGRRSSGGGGRRPEPVLAPEPKPAAAPLPQRWQDNPDYTPYEPSRTTTLYGITPQPVVPEPQSARPRETPAVEYEYGWSPGMEMIQPPGAGVGPRVSFPYEADVAGGASRLHEVIEYEIDKLLKG